MMKSTRKSKVEKKIMETPTSEQQGSENADQREDDGSNATEIIFRNITYTKENVLVVDGINGHTYDAATVRLALGCVFNSRLFSKYDPAAKMEFNSDTGMPLKGALIEAMGRTLFDDLIAAGLIFWCGDPLESSMCISDRGFEIFASLSVRNLVQPIV
jgi:hypothetical protein